MGSRDGDQEFAGDAGRDYRKIFAHMLDGYALHELICDDQGRPVDYRFLDLNPSFERITGLEAKSLRGRTVLEVLPQTEPFWIETYGRVVLTGEPVHFTHVSGALNRHFEVSAFRTAPRQFACTFSDITDRKQAEERLRESEEKRRRLFEKMSEGVFYQLADGTLTDVNDAALRMVGLSREEFLSRTSMTSEWSVIKEDGTPMKWIDHPSMQAMRTRRPVQDVMVGIWNPVTNDYTWVAVSAIPEFRDGEQAPYQAVVTMHDLTERIQAEEALKQSEHRFRSLYDNAPLSYQSLDETGCFLDVNPYWLQTLGYSREEVIGKPFTDFLHPDWVPLFEEKFPDFKRIGSVSDVQYRMRHKQGHYRDVSFNGCIGGCQTDGRVQTYCVFQDITERENARRELAEEKERLAVTLRSIGDGVISTDTDGRIVMLNRAAEVLTGWSSDEAAGRRLPDVFHIIHESTRKLCENPVEKVLATGGIVELANHTCLIARDGKEITIADSGAPIHDKNSRIIGVVLVFRDMTERQRLDDSLRRAQKLESLGLLAGGIAHDFNNLLTGIFGYLEMAREYSSEDDVVHFLDGSLASIDRAKALTRQLLTFSKGGAPIKKVEYLFPFVQETVQFALSGSSVSSRCSIAEGLWSCDYDKNQLGQVIDNVTINAQQAMPGGGILLVTATNVVLAPGDHASLKAGQYVKLSLQDQGIGIPKEIIPRIFDPYYTTKAAGHGLGLSTCYSIMQKHGGCIDVESEPGKGSTFHLYLPATSEQADPVIKAKGRRYNGVGTFLVMDDEKNICKLIKLMLESSGYQVVIKHDGAEALAFVEAEMDAGRPLAGMIFDLTIPGGMGGKETISRIRNICSETPVFVASGYSDDPIMSDPERYGFTASIIKPFRKAELFAVLEQYMK